MSDITINPANGQIGFKANVTTGQIVGYQITVIAPDGNTELEHYLSGSQKNNPYTIKLPKPVASYLNCYVSGTFTIIDPIGSGNPFSINFSIQQNGADLNPVSKIIGTTANGKIIRTAIFHLK